MDGFFIGRNWENNLEKQIYGKKWRKVVNLIYICPTNSLKPKCTMKNLSIKSDLIKKEISIIYGFEVDYNPLLAGKDFNNNGTWGKIIDEGQVVISVAYNPNKGAPNFGPTDFQSKLDYMKMQLSVMQSLQPKQIQSLING
jgi:hypothetical protein